ncbi:MAG: hypothetical protein KGH75_11085, partial [Rhodospirillales bacterium]|nr:hypothetical protein [Rhodospirillales bacterium]
MAVPVLITDLSATATSNSPADTDAISTTLPQYIRAIESILYTQVSRGADIPSAATLTIPAGGSFFNVTGTTGITSIAA